MRFYAVLSKSKGNVDGNTNYSFLASIKGGLRTCLRLAPGGKESSCSAGDLGLILGMGRSPGEEKGYPLQYSGLENSMHCIVRGIAKSQTRLSTFHFHFAIYWTNNSLYYYCFSNKALTAPVTRLFQCHIYGVNEKLLSKLISLWKRIK